MFAQVVVMEKHGPIRAYVQRRFERLWRPLSELVGLAADSFISDEQVMAVVADRLKTEIEGSLQNLGNGDFRRGLRSCCRRRDRSFSRLEKLELKQNFVPNPSLAGTCYVGDSRP